MKKIPQSFYFIISGVLFLIGALVLRGWITSYHEWNLREHLIIMSPLFLEIIFFLVVVAVGINIKVFKKVFAGVPRRIWLYLAAIVIVGLFITMFIAPREHRIYYDEDIYENIGQNIAYLKNTGAYFSEDYEPSISNLWKRFIGRAGMCNEGTIEYGEYACNRLEYNKEPNGWAYLLSVVFRLFGVHELAAFLTTNVLYAFMVITVFLIGYLLSENALLGLYAALMCALTPQLIIWSNTTAVEPSAAFFPGVALLCTLVFIKSREVKSLFLAVVMTAFAIQFRPESIMLLAVIGLALLFWSRDEFKKPELYLMLALFFILIIPHLVHLYAVKNIGWGSSGPKFSTMYFNGNFKVNALFYLKNVWFPLLFTVLFIVGIAFKGGKKEGTFAWKEKTLILLWFLLFWGIFIFFYAGSYGYGADVRFSLLSYMPFALIAGNGAASFTNLITQKFKLNKYINFTLTALIIFSFIPFLPSIRAITQEAWGARADHRFAREMAKMIPDDSLVLTHNPNMFLVWGKSAAQASLATEHSRDFKRLFYQYRGGLYFHYNFWCNVPDPLQNSFCKNILEKFNCTLVVSFKEQDYKFELYKIEKKEEKPVTAE